MLKSIAGLTVGVLVCASAFGQTAEDCILEYEGLRAQFEAVEQGVLVDCVQDGHIIALDAEADAMPKECLDPKSHEMENLNGLENHWHLKAKAILGPNPVCIVQLLGFTGEALDAALEKGLACGTEEKRIDLPANEGAKWRNYLREQCPKEEE